MDHLSKSEDILYAPSVVNQPIATFQNMEIKLNHVGHGGVEVVLIDIYGFHGSEGKPGRFK